MAAAAGFLNQAMATGQPLAGARVSPMATSSSDANSAETKGSASGITANDFLTLLVTEMKNQDPTANTDPNEYINQLVNVNSLQQLISINETLTSAYGTSNTSAYVQPAVHSTPVDSISTEAQAKPEATSLSTSAVLSKSNTSSEMGSIVPAIISNLTHGNLSAPAVNPAAERLAHALGGRSSAPISN